MNFILKVIVCANVPHLLLLLCNKFEPYQRNAFERMLMVFLAFWVYQKLGEWWK